MGIINIPPSSATSTGGATITFSLLALLVVLSSFSVHHVSPANILFHHSVASWSHRVATYPLASALADRGHAVTFITSQPLRPGSVEVNPKIKEIVPKQVETIMEAFLAHDLDINLRVQKLLPKVVHTFFPLGTVLCESLFVSPEFKGYLSQTKTLDLIVMDHCMTECISVLAHLYNAKLVAFGTVMQIGNEYDAYGFAPESSAVPEAELDPEKVPMGLLARMRNTFVSLHWRYVHYEYMKQLDGIARKHVLGLEGMPHLDEVARNISLFLYSGNLVTDYPRSQPPLFVNVAGMHCRRGKPLPAELENFIGKGSEGFVYISLGSAVAASSLPERIKQVFFSTMEEFPKLRFLWKWDGEVPESYPSNLHLSKWYPQQDLLGHPKIKAFVSQNGRPSSVEAVYHAVPMISFPVIADQDFNVNRLHEMGANVILELGTVTKEELKEAVLRTAYDSRIKTRMLDLQKILVDQPMAPVEKAVWWVEYVLRHKDTTHLRPMGFHQSWYQRRLLDVWGLLFGALFLSILLLFKILASFVKMVRGLFKDQKNTSSSSSAKRAKKDS